MLLLIILLLIGMLFCKTMKGVVAFTLIGFLVITFLILVGAVGMVAMMHP